MQKHTIKIKKLSKRVITGLKVVEILKAEEGIDRIWTFYEEFCVRHPPLNKRLIEHEFYQIMDMEFEQKIL